MRDTVEFDTRAALRYGADGRMYLEMTIDGAVVRAADPIPVDLQQRIEHSGSYSVAMQATTPPTDAEAVA